MRTPNEMLIVAREKLDEKKSSTRRALSSKDNFICAIEVNETAHGRSEERSFWKNEDLDLTPPSQWTWGWYDFAAFWWSYGFSVGVWSVGSSMVAMGLNSWQCMFTRLMGSRSMQLTLPSYHLRLHLASSRRHRDRLALQNRLQMALRIPCRKPRHVGNVWQLLSHHNPLAGRPDLDISLNDARRLLLVNPLSLRLRTRMV